MRMKFFISFIKYAKEIAIAQTHDVDLMLFGRYNELELAIHSVPN